MALTSIIAEYVKNKTQYLSFTIKWVVHSLEHLFCLHKEEAITYKKGDDYIIAGKCSYCGEVSKERNCVDIGL